jgi:hypothetical protein
VVVKSPIFWYIKPSRPLNVNRRFRGKFRYHLQGRKISQASNQHEAGSACYLLRPGFLLALFFDPEDKGNIFSEMSVAFQQTTGCYIPEDKTFQLACVILYKLKVLRERYFIFFLVTFLPLV